MSSFFFIHFKITAWMDLSRGIWQREQGKGSRFAATQAVFEVIGEL